MGVEQPVPPGVGFQRDAEECVPGEGGTHFLPAGRPRGDCLDG